MEQSIFAAWLAEYFPGLTLRIVESYNDEKKLPTYLFRTFLKKNFSVDGKWETLSVNNQLVAADLITMDSSIPLKTRPSLGKASGDIPKMGMELALREKELTDLNTLVALGRNTEALAKLFADTPMVIGGQYERLEAMFLEGLSSGIVEVTNTETVGTAVRVNYGFLDANKFESTISWDDTATATPLTDMQQVFDKAELDGNTIVTIMMDRPTFNRVKASAEGKALYATTIGNFGTTLTVPTTVQFLSAFKDEFGADLVIIDRSVRLQRNGVNTNIKPWKAGSVAFVTTNDLGSYVYARLAEQDHPVAGVVYETVDDFMLVSKYRMNRPSLMEVTNSQSRVVPVIDNPDAIYLLDSTQDNG